MIVEISKENIEYIRELEKIFSTIFSYKNYIINDFEKNVFTKYFIYMEKNNIIGFVNYYDLYDRFEIVNINVIEQFRNKKIASKMMEYIIKKGYENNIKNITLEVDEKNQIAIKLYKKYNFVNVAMRKKYYNGSDGILMERKMM